MLRSVPNTRPAAPARGRIPASPRPIRARLTRLPFRATAHPTPPGRTRGPVRARESRGEAAASGPRQHDWGLGAGLEEGKSSGVGTETGEDLLNGARVLVVED